MATRMAILAGGTKSARADTRLRFLAERLAPYSANGGVGGFLDTYRAANRCRLGGGVVAGAKGPVSGAYGRRVEVTEERGNEV
jgi:hypothetical protein